MSGSNPSPVQQVRTGTTGHSMSRGSIIGLAAIGIGSLAGIVYFTSTPPTPPPQPPQNEGAPGATGAPFEPYKPPVQRTAANLPAPQSTGLPLPRSTSPLPAAVTGQSSGYRPTPLMAFGDASGRGGEVGAASTGRDPGDRREQQGDPDPLSARLRADDLPMAVAQRGPDRNLTLAEGTPIPCVPDSPITSDVEGVFRCKVPEAVFSESGNVPMLDNGTWIVGRVGSGLRRGQRRLFVTFTKIQTPQGCRVSIRAPGADALGQAGLDGEIDTHFFARFGAYLGMAFLDAAMQGAVLAASSSLSRGGVQFNQFQNSGRQGGQALFQEDAQIPSTLYRNQAEPIVVRLTQDIDMRPCFRLRLREDRP